MPNLCLSEVYIHGAENEIQTLYDKIKEFTSHNAKANDFGLEWLGNIILNAGFKTTDEDQENGFESRGSIADYRLVNKNELGIFTETAYGQMNRIWVALIEKYAPNCKLHFIAYEPNNEVFEKYEDLSDSILYFNDIDYNIEVDIEDKTHLNKYSLNLINKLEEKTGWGKKELLQIVNSFLLGKGQEKIEENQLEDFFKNYIDEIDFLKIGSVVFDKYKILNKDEI